MLVVEDDPNVRDLVRTILTRAGYEVMLAANGEDALVVVFGYAGPISLVIADIVMPRMSGRELVDRLREVRPEMKALYMSGYAPDTIARHGLADPSVPLLEKPFTADMVLKTVRSVLTAPGPTT